MWAWGDWSRTYGGPALRTYPASLVDRVMRCGPDGAVIGVSAPEAPMPEAIAATEAALVSLGGRGPVGVRLWTAVSARYLRGHDLPDSKRAELFGESVSGMRRALDDAHWWLDARLARAERECRQCGRRCLDERRAVRAG